jgi:aldose 1-epimerase
MLLACRYFHKFVLKSSQRAMKQFTTLVFAILIVSSLGSCHRSQNAANNQTNTASTPAIMKTHFGNTGGKEVFLYTLTNSNGITVKITNYGGIITSILTPDKSGRMGDIVLGYDSLNDYIANSPYFGAIVGRYANRIARGSFALGGKRYKLAVNNGNNSLHGGLKGFDKVVWDAKEISGSNSVSLELTYLSKDGEEGYPGNLAVKVTYTLDDRDELTVLIEAESDKPTPVNLCNHTYFNLSEADTSILGHMMTICADRFTEVNDELIPTGKLPAVGGTAMDFNNPTAIGARIAQVKGGYDHNYVLSKKPGELSLAAQVYDPRTGRRVGVCTTQPGVQFYTGNFLDGTIHGKGGKIYRQHYGFCLETQHFPDSPNQPAFPNTILKPGEKFAEKTIFKFTVNREQ